MLLRRGTAGARLPNIVSIYMPQVTALPAFRVCTAAQGVRPAILTPALLNSRSLSREDLRTAYKCKKKDGQKADLETPPFYPLCLLATQK